MRALQILGCASGVGKSLITAGLGRALKLRGHRVAPFKAQNMSLQAAVTPDGGEIGRAQALQAKACGLAPDRRMNPILIKPLDHLRSQVIVNGDARADLSALPWKERQAKLWPFIQTAYDSLAHDYEVILIEGAGSPAEINLRQSDLANIAMGEYAKPEILLVGDIDRGGVYAHLHGTYLAMPESLRPRLTGFVLNKFRGDADLLTEANLWLLEKTGREVLATLPWLDLRLPEEDSPAASGGWDGTKWNLALIHYPQASNVDDFDPLRAEPGVNLVGLHHARNLQGFDAILLPGSRNVPGSLAYLRERGMDKALLKAVEAGIPVLGICGGLQMLGDTIEDPHGLEIPGGGTAPGLGLLPLATRLERDKRTQTVHTTCEYGCEVHGYEIRHGQSRPLAELTEHMPNGWGWRKGKVAGSYVHGLFHHPDYRREFLASLGNKDGEPSPADFDFENTIDQDLNRLAMALENSGLVEKVLAHQAAAR